MYKARISQAAASKPFESLENASPLPHWAMNGAFHVLPMQSNVTQAELPVASRLPHWHANQFGHPTAYSPLSPGLPNYAHHAAATRMLSQTWGSPPISATRNEINNGQMTYRRPNGQAVFENHDVQMRAANRQPDAYYCHLNGVDQPAYAPFSPYGALMPVPATPPDAFKVQQQRPLLLICNSRTPPRHPVIPPERKGTSTTTGDVTTTDGAASDFEPAESDSLSSSSLHGRSTVHRSSDGSNRRGAGVPFANRSPERETLAGSRQTPNRPSAVPKLTLKPKSTREARPTPASDDEFEMPLLAPRGRPGESPKKPEEIPLPPVWGWDSEKPLDQQHFHISPQLSPDNLRPCKTERGTVRRQHPAPHWQDDCEAAHWSLTEQGQPSPRQISKDEICLRAMGTVVRVPRESLLSSEDVRWSHKYVNCNNSVEVNLDTINSGTFCKVYRARYGGDVVAVKCPDVDYLASDPLMAQYRAIQEWRILCRAKHKNVLRFVGGVDGGPQGVWLVTEYVSGGDLYALLHLRPSMLLRPTVRLRMMKQITDTLAYLHGLKPKIVHKDLKTNNILVDENLNLKLCDFGDAEEMRSKYVQRYTAATWQYAPPEIVGADDPSCPKFTTEKVDVWALGCVFLEICLAATPFKHLLEAVPDVHQRDVLRERLFAGKLEGDIRIPEYLPPTLAQLVQICLVIDSEKRASAVGVKDFITRHEDVLLHDLDYAQRAVEYQYSASSNPPRIGEYPGFMTKRRTPYHSPNQSPYPHFPSHNQLFDPYSNIRQIPRY